MRNLLLLDYEAAAVLLPGLVLCAALYRRGGKTGRAAPPLLLLLFAIYLFGVFHVTGAGTMYDALQRGLEWNAGQVNLLPFSREADPMGYALNVVLFLPFGLLLPLLWPALDRLGRVAAGGFAFSLLIELSQLLNNRRTDVDDLLMNTLGAALGLLLYRALAWAGQRCGRKRGEVCEPTPALYIVALFAGRFLLFHELWAAGLLYGFAG